MSKKKTLIIAIAVIVLLVIGIAAFFLLKPSNNTDTPETTNPEETTQTEEIINKDEVNVEIDNIEEYGEIQFIYGPTSSKENIINSNPADGDIVIMNGYQYTYNTIFVDQYTTMKSDIGGWSVYSIDKNRKVAEGIRETVFGIAVKSMNYCYKGCENLETVKEIPATIETANGAFESCAKLTTCSALPNGLTDARNMFAYCTNLKTAPQLPETLKTIDMMFYFCRNLTGHVNIPTGIETFNKVFERTQEEITVSGDENIIEIITREFWNVSKK